jgi:hypothetical protein
VTTRRNLFLVAPTQKEQINIYNPTVEEFGWQSTHTVIEIVLPDRPFILESVTMEINRYGLVNQLVLHPYECLIPHNLFAAGIGNMLVSRVSPQGEVAVCSFIIDVYCLGVKQARLKTMPIPEYEKVFKPGIVESHGGYAFTKIKPACAKKLLDGAAQYAKDLGFHSPSSYHALKNIFGKLWGIRHS